MDIVAHGLWAGAAAVAARRKYPKLSVAGVAFWAMFPDLLAFGPSVAAGLWLRLTSASTGGRLRHHVDLGFPAYPTGHSLVIFAAAFLLVSLAFRRPVLSMLGWLLHILIDIPTHSFSYYATRFLWPFTNFGIDGIPWWNRWMMAATYAALAVTYYWLWKKGWLWKRRRAR